MGIRGLLSYIHNYSFLKDYDLFNTTLVIDGNSVMTTMYVKSGCNFCFGGEYMEFAYYVSEFFDEMSRCNVTPIVIFDGGNEEKKKNTAFKRLQERILKVYSSATTEQIVFSSMIRSVFINIAKKRGIKVVQSIFEADHHVASVARILKCPVLSFDSDFVIYDVVFIPFDSLKLGIESNANGIVKQCKIFDRERFFQEYPKLNNKLLSLAASILDNDYVQSSVFKDFFLTLKVTRAVKQNFEKSTSHLKIVALFHWLQKQTFESAVAKVMSKVDQDKQQSVLKIIEIILDDYLNPSKKMLFPLGYTKEEIDKLMQNIKHESFNFENLADFELKEVYDNDEVYFYVDESIENSSDVIIEVEVEDKIENIVPTWFLNDYYNAR